MNPIPRQAIQRHLAASAAAVMTALTCAAATAQEPARPAALAPAVAAPRQTLHDAALEQYETGHYPLAFAMLAQLADEDHCESARIAHQMVRFGRVLYGAEFAVAPARLAKWRALRACPTALATR